jgi:hypothetical protein
MKIFRSLARKQIQYSLRTKLRYSYSQNLNENSSDNPIPNSTTDFSQDSLREKRVLQLQMPITSEQLNTKSKNMKRIRG